MYRPGGEDEPHSQFNRLFLTSLCPLVQNDNDVLIMLDMQIIIRFCNSNNNVVLARV